MKKTVFVLLLAAMLSPLCLAANAGVVSGEKDDDNGVKAKIWLNKGEEKVLNGYLRSAIIGRPDHIEFSLTPDGERTRYLNEDVDSLLLEGSDKYVKRLVKGTGLAGGKAKVEWVREEYLGKGIDLYSLVTVETEKIGTVTRIASIRSWYLSIAGDVAIMVGTDNCGNVFDRQEPSMSKAVLSRYFGKIYDYKDFAERISSGEFPGFMDVIYVWEASYGHSALRAEGKLSTDQIGVQGGVASSDAAKNVDWKRTKTEIVFPKYTRTIQVGVSPVVAPWSRVMKHASTSEDKASFKMVVPPVMLYSDICFLDFGRFGSLGWTVGGEYSRYGYNWMRDDGYGDKRQDTFCNRFDIAAGLSYHLTLCRRLELYARAMLDAGLIGEHTTDHESGEKASSAFNKMDTKITFVATAGLRWYFCEMAGLWVEGGHDTGYVSAGVSFRF